MDQALSGSSVTSLDITGEPSLDPLLHSQQLTVPFRNQSSVHGFHNDPQITIFTPDSLQSSRLHTRLSELSRGWLSPTSICRSILFPYWRSPTISVKTSGSCHCLLFFFQNAPQVSQILKTPFSRDVFSLVNPQGHQAQFLLFYKRPPFLLHEFPHAVLRLPRSLSPTQ